MKRRRVIFWCSGVVYLLPLTGLTAVVGGSDNSGQRTRSASSDEDFL